MKIKFLSVAVILTILFTSSCTSIGTQQYTYVGDATREKNVMGKSTHYDFLGFGITSEQYANEYNNAIKNAFKKGGSNTKELTNVKIFKANKTWPQVLGSALIIAGYIFGSTSQDPESDSGMAMGMMFGGTVLNGLNVYDFVVVAEPVY